MTPKEVLEEAGIDTDNLDIDLDSELSPEDAEVIQEALMEQIREDILEKGESHTPYEIKYYDADSLPKDEDKSVFSFGDLVRQFDRIEEEGLEIGQKMESGVRIDNNTPQKLYDEFCKGLLGFAEQEISQKRDGKLYFARAVLSDDSLNADEAVRWFEERDTVDFRAFNSRLFDSDRNLGLGKNEKVYEQTIEEYWDGLSNLDVEQEERLKRGLMLDLTKTLEGLAHHRDEGFHDQVKRYQEVLEKFRPEVYEEALDENFNYTLLPVRGKRKMTILSDTVGTCLTKFGDREKSIEANSYRDGIRMHKDDPFTLVHAIGKGKDLKGYMRNFLMEDADGNSFLALDTVEVIGVSGMELEDIHEDMQHHSDTVSAAGLGAMKLGQELGVDYLTGKDSRIKFGPRPGYSNTSRDITYSKIGETVPFYSAGETWDEKEVERYLPEYGEIGWEAPYRKKVPWFAEYCENMEARGFDVMPGERTTEAKILMEFPGDY